MKRIIATVLLAGSLLVGCGRTDPATAVAKAQELIAAGKADEARILLDSIDTSTVMGLRDRALIALMAYTFARVSAATAMKVEDYFVQGRRGWVRLYEKGGKRHEVPAHHNLDAYIEAYIKVAGLQDDAKGYLFRTVAGKTGRLTPLPLSQADAYRMIRRRCPPKSCARCPPRRAGRRRRSSGP